MNLSLPGQRWEIEIEKAIKSSTHFLILLSSHSTGKRGFVQKELRLALDVLDQCPEEDIYILPVRLDECNPSLKIKALHWVDLYPEGQYVNGLRKILQVVRPEAFMLRNKPKELSQADVVDMIRKHGFYEYSRNPDGVGFSHKYLKKEIRSKTVIYDEATNLIWQQSGSKHTMSYHDIGNWIALINKDEYAGFHDWNLPTLEEVMSLMEPKRNISNIFIDEIFDNAQIRIWTSDKLEGKYWTWIIDFGLGKCYNNFDRFTKNHVRLVRSGK